MRSRIRLQMKEPGRSKPGILVTIRALIDENEHSIDTVERPGIASLTPGPQSVRSRESFPLKSCSKIGVRIKGK